MIKAFVAVDPLKYFNRLVLVADRKTTIEECLTYELTVLPMSLFDQYQMMRKSDKVALGRYLKNINQCTLKSCSFMIPLVIYGDWFIHQLSSFKGCDKYREVTKEYLKLIPKNREVTVIFDGYEPSTKDHEHKRRVIAFRAEIAVKESTFCSVTKTKFLTNNNNKKELIDLISSIFTVNGIEVIRACNDADTLIVKKTLEMSFYGDVELMAEDTDIVGEVSPSCCQLHSPKMAKLSKLQTGNVRWHICGL